MITYPNVKLNLGLSVIRKRPDGYHDLETLFVPYTGLHDTLEIISGDDFSRTLSSLLDRYVSGGQCLPENVLRTPPSSRWAPPSYDAEGGTVFQETLSSVAHSSHSQTLDDANVSQFSHETISSVAHSSHSQTLDDANVSQFSHETISSVAIKQAIREDGKVMVTIARAEGVDWDPLKDLTVKAYEILEQDFKLPPVKIFLEKTSPVGAGLGGGSADAAFALRMMSEMFNLGLDDASLAAYAARLGSDCAFFVYNRPMIGSGRGEILEPYDIDLSAYDVRVVIPEGVAVSTADAYRGITPHEPSVPVREALTRPVAEWRECLVNDFEATVFAKYPAIAAAKERLYADGALYASMSGSGSALFALFSR